jgi:DNA-binding CsgD family transcriptional regulator
LVATSSDDVEAEVIMRESEREMQRIAQEIASRLTPKQTLILELAAAGQSQREIGLKLRCTQQAVSKELQRARAVAAEYLSPQTVSRSGVRCARSPASERAGVYAEPLLRNAPYKSERLNREYCQASGIQKHKPKAKRRADEGCV